MYSNNQNRRNFLKTVSLSLAVAPVGLLGAGSSSPGIDPGAGASRKHPATNGPLGPIKQINAGLLHVGYVDTGPAGGPVVLLLHGWPYDIHSYADVAPVLAAKGYRVIIPYCRGCGTTTFLSAETVRNGQPAALAQDVIDLMDALKIEKAVVEAPAAFAQAIIDVDKL